MIYDDLCLSAGDMLSCSALFAGDCSYQPVRLTWFAAIKMRCLDVSCIPSFLLDLQKHPAKKIWQRIFVPGIQSSVWLAFPFSHPKTPEIWSSYSHDGSMVLVYMLTWLGYIDGIHVTIYSIHGSYGIGIDIRKYDKISWDDGILKGFSGYPLII